MKIDELRPVLKECLKPGYFLSIIPLSLSNSYSIAIYDHTLNSYQRLDISQYTVETLSWDTQKMEDFIDFLAKSTSAFVFSPRYLRNFTILMNNILHCHNQPGKLYP